jgi:hypothetical protein
MGHPVFKKNEEEMGKKGEWEEFKNDIFPADNVDCH